MKLSKNKLEEEEGEGERKGGEEGAEKKNTNQNQIKTETNDYLGPREMDNKTLHGETCTAYLTVTTIQYFPAENNILLLYADKETDRKLRELEQHKNVVSGLGTHTCGPEFADTGSGGVRALNDL